MSFEENFLYPAYLILLGGLVSGILIPIFNELIKRRQRDIEELKRQKQINIDRKREDHRNEIEIKSTIIKQIAEISAVVGFQIYDLSGKKNSNADSSIDKLYEKWFKETGVITALIDAYFRESQIMKDWALFANNSALVWGLFDRVAQNSNLTTENLSELKKYFKGKVDIDWDELNEGKDVVKGYNTLSPVLTNLRDKMIRQILNEKINTGIGNISDD